MQDIIKILKQFEQRDYKRGGVSIAPENYEAIARKIHQNIVEPEVIAKEHFRKQRDEGLLEMYLSKTIEKQ